MLAISKPLTLLGTAGNGPTNGNASSAGNGTTSFTFRTLHLTRPSTPSMPSISVSDGTTHDTGISIVLNNVPATNPPLPAGVEQIGKVAERLVG